MCWQCHVVSDWDANVHLCVVFLTVCYGVCTSFHGLVFFGITLICVYFPVLNWCGARSGKIWSLSVVMLPIISQSSENNLVGYICTRDHSTVPWSTPMWHQPGWNVSLLAGLLWSVDQERFSILKWVFQNAIVVRFMFRAHLPKAELPCDPVTRWTEA